MDKETQERLNQIDKRFDDLEQQIGDIRSVVVDMSKHLNKAFKTIDENFEKVGKRIEVVESKIDALSTSSSKEFEMVGGKLQDLHDEVIKIQKVSGYNEQYENLLKIVK